MKHCPPIPPNSSWFFESGACQYDLHACGSVAHEKFDNRIIAAVARCAWLDYAASLPPATVIEWGLWDDHGKGDALRNADEWRKWGEQK